jgi:hypothetical protein
MRSRIGEEEIRFISEFVILENHPDAEIIKRTYEEKLEVSQDGTLVNTSHVNIVAYIPSSAESITIDLKISGE